MATINKPITSQIGYGPIESVIYNIDKGLHDLGHRSIVACSLDSIVTGEKLATVPHSFGDYWRACSPTGQSYVDLHLSRAMARAQLGDIDIIHMHEWFERVYSGKFTSSVPIVMTLHTPGRHSGFAEFRAQFPKQFSQSLIQFVAISEYQKREYRDLIPVAKTVLHGIDVEQYLFKREHSEPSYLFNIGRITWVKGQDIAIAAAKKSGRRLILAGCVQNKKEDVDFFARLRPSIDLVVDVNGQPADENYYDKVMQPILSSNKQIIYIGELNTAQKKYWYQYALATLFPIRWGEPFGMVLIESMAAGTPILAFEKGAVSEIVRNGETGFVVSSLESMVDAVRSIEHIDRQNCRNHVKRNFSIERMAKGYEAMYRQLASESEFSTRHSETDWYGEHAEKRADSNHIRKSCQETFQ